MHIHKVTVRNFRLLADVELVLEDQTTLIVGRNNSGKTSLSEAIRRFLVDQSPKFQIEDFSNASYDGFCDALKAEKAGHFSHPRFCVLTNGKERVGKLFRRKRIEEISLVLR